MDLLSLQFDAVTCNGESGDDDSHVFSFVDCVAENNKTLASCNSLQLKRIVSYVNASLDGFNSKGDLLRGLALLGVLVEQASTDAFAELHSGWIQSLITLLVKSGAAIDPGVRLLASETLTLIFDYVSNFPDFVRHLSTSVVPQLVQQLIINSDVDDENVVSDVALIRTVLRHFPGACRSHVSSLRRRIICLLLSSPSNKTEVRSTAAKCLALLPWVGRLSSEHVTASSIKLDPETNWTILYEQLCCSIHVLLDTLYDGYENGCVVEACRDQAERFFPSWYPEHERQNDPLSSCRTTENLLMCISEMLTVNDHPSKVNSRTCAVPIEMTMTLLCRIFNVNLKTLSSNLKYLKDQKTLVISLALPGIHCQTMSLLRHLLMVCGRHMSLHGTSVLGIVVKTLQWTNDNSHGSLRMSTEDVVDHPLASLRIAAYDVLVTWLESVQSPGSLGTIENPLIANMLCDVMYKQNQQSIVLLHGRQQSKTSTKKKVKRDFCSVVDVVHRKVRPQSDSELCLAALDAINTVLCYGADVLKTKFLEDIHATILKVCRSVQLSMSIAHWPIPYGNPECRRALYELLLATLVHRTPTFAPDISTCIGIFSRGSTLDLDCIPLGHAHSYKSVSRCCTNALATCQLLINPYRPSVYNYFYSNAVSTSPLTINNVVEESDGLAMDVEEEPVEIITVDDRQEETTSVENHHGETTSVEDHHGEKLAVDNRHEEIISLEDHLEKNVSNGISADFETELVAPNIAVYDLSDDEQVESADNLHLVECNGADNMNVVAATETCEDVDVSVAAGDNNRSSHVTPPPAESAVNMMIAFVDSGPDK